MESDEFDKEIIAKRQLTSASVRLVRCIPSLVASLRILIEKVDPKFLNKNCGNVYNSVDSEIS